MYFIWLSPFQNTSALHGNIVHNTITPIWQQHLPANSQIKIWHPNKRRNWKSCQLAKWKSATILITDSSSQVICPEMISNMNKCVKKNKKQNKTRKGSSWSKHIWGYHFELECSKATPPFDCYTLNYTYIFSLKMFYLIVSGKGHTSFDQMYQQLSITPSIKRFKPGPGVAFKASRWWSSAALQYSNISCISLHLTQADCAQKKKKLFCFSIVLYSVQILSMLYFSFHTVG